MADYITASLNPSQEKAVRHSPDIPLQILAGPGSGKTKVLTSRIAHLILHHRIPPSAICAVTFTNKAANEMKERLSKLIGRDWTYQIKMGTFHALCALFLRRHGTLAGVDSNFTICDADESEKLITKLVKPRLEEWEAKGIIIKAKTVMSVISKAKAQGHNPQQYLRFSVAKDGIIPPNPPPPDPLTVMFAEVYTDYQKALRKSNSLDFDDLLVYGVKLFRGHDKVVKWCRHVLVDEFQDTNTMQYAIMKHLATHHTSVTVVGDPDQSIYGWRSADVTNLKKMQKDFPTTEQIFLEENYRSTASILAVSLAIVSKDKTRIPKSLHTSHPQGTIPMLGTFRDEKMEAQFIATETKRLVAASGGMFEWKDFVILLRFNALSRALEAALQKEGIPNRVLNGHKFFERIEIKDLLAYLQTVDNPLFVPAFVRCINTPPRTIGEKSVNEILARAEKDKISPLTLLEGIYDGKMPDIKPAVKRKIGTFVPTIRKLRKLANSGTPPADLIRELLELTAYEGYLKKLFPDWETRWENVQELITFAAQPQETIRMDLDAVEVPQASQSQDQSQSQEQEDVEMYDIEQDGFMVVDEPANKGKEKEKEKPVTTPPKTEQGLLETPLRTFLQASMLSTDSETREDGDKNKVTISTCHAAKGLEWPVVFVPAVEKDIFPFYRTEDTEEERRLLYVACTRAQGLLYISNVVGRMHGGKVKFTQVSEFISAVLKDDLTLTTTQPPAMNYPEVEVISRVLRQPCPSIEDINRRMREYEKAGVHVRRGETLMQMPQQVPQYQSHVVDVHRNAESSTMYSTEFKSGKKILESGSVEPNDPAMIQQTAGASTSRIVIVAASTPQMDDAQSDDPRVSAFLARKAEKAQTRALPRVASPSRRKPASKIAITTSPTHDMEHEPMPPPPTASPPGHRNRNSYQTDVSTPPSTQALTSTRPPPVTRNAPATASGPSCTPQKQKGKSKPPPVSQARSSEASPPRAGPSRVSANTSPRKTKSSLSTALPRIRAPVAPQIHHHHPAIAPHSSSPSIPSSHTVSSSPVADPAGPVAGVKRRLGMGRPHTGYANKKFKPPGQ